MFFNQRTFIFLSIIIVAIAGVAAPETLNYRSYVFCTLYMNLFSYEDGTELTVYDSEETLYSGVLDKGEHVLILLPEPYVGAFEVAGSKKFSVLTGHAPKSGYYAIDQNGKGVSTEFYTYVPIKEPSYGYQKFVVFAYEDGTELTVEYADPNMVYHEVVTDYALDKGENWSSEDLSDKYVHVSSNKPVSALSCYDTGYFVPSADGTFSGTRFYTYIGKTTGAEHLPQDLVVTAYDDDTQVTIADCNDPGVVTWQGTLNGGEVHVERFPDGANDPFSVTSSRPVTVSVQQWVTNNEYSEYDEAPEGFFVPGRDGTRTGGLGRDILVPTQQTGYLAIMAYMDNTHVKVYNEETGLLLDTHPLREKQHVIDYPGNGLWRIVSDRPISAYTGIRCEDGAFLYNAEFAPLVFDVTTGDMVKVSVKSGLGDCTEPEDSNYCFESSDPNNNEICYTIAYWSDPNDDTDVVITDYLPREVEFISADPNTGFYDPNNHTCRWDIGEVTGGDPCSYCYLTVQVTEYAQPGQKIVNKVELASHASYSTAEVSIRICCPENPIIYVKADAPGFRNGSSWADAYTTLQPALTRAKAGFGNEIWVAEGVYNPSKYITRTPLSLLGGVEMYGGFAGDETIRDDRDYVHNKTCLDGDIDGQGDNDSFRVVYVGRYISTDCVLDGFIIQGAVPSPYPWLFLNAGVLCDYSMPTIRNCVIRKNSDHGIMCELASPRISDCRIEENYGSGLYSAAGFYFTVAGRPIVKRCVIRENRVGLESLDNGRPIITNSWIYHNTKEGISLTWPDDSVIIQDNTIVGNGTYGIQSNQQVDLSNCIVWGNNPQLSTNCNAIYSCIQDSNEVNPYHNINTNPDFAYDDPNDYHLGPASPCIDEGHDPNGDGTYYDNLDIDGNVRVYNGRVDMGADEYTCDDIYNDVDWNSDRIVDTQDLIVLAIAWLSYGPFDENDPNTYNWNPDCDTQPENGDWDIDYGDFAVFGAEWLWEPCWTISGPSAPMMMGMGGGMYGMMGMESMLMAEQQAESQQSYSEPTIEEQIAQIKRLLDFWLREDVREELEDKEA